MQQVAFTPAGKSYLAHRGFNDVYMSAREGIYKLLKMTDFRKPLFVTGHSLGGALATLASLDIAINRKPDNLIVYTFGSPRVGDPSFARKYNSAVPISFRVQNEFDVVPHLPPLIYTPPKSQKTYYYMHVKEEAKRSFRNGSVSANHVIGSYFHDLANDAPTFAAAVCMGPPGWCPAK